MTRVQALTASMAIVGICLLVAGWLLPNSRSIHAWSDAQASEYARASAAYHRVQSAEDSDSFAAKLPQVRAEYQKIRRQLDTARERPRQIGFWLKTSGTALICCSAALTWRQSAKN